MPIPRFNTCGPVCTRYYLGIPSKASNFLACLSTLSLSGTTTQRCDRIDRRTSVWEFGGPQIFEGFSWVSSVPPEDPDIVTQMRPPSLTSASFALHYSLDLIDNVSVICYRLRRYINHRPKWIVSQGMRIEFWWETLFGRVHSEWGDVRWLEQAGDHVMAGFRIFGV